MLVHNHREQSSTYILSCQYDLMMQLVLTLHEDLLPPVTTHAEFANVWEHIEHLPFEESLQLLCPLVIQIHKADNDEWEAWDVPGFSLPLLVHFVMAQVTPCMNIRLGTLTYRNIWGISLFWHNILDSR